MAISKVVLHDDSGADRTLVDLTGDTVAPETLMEGATAHDKAGNPITGTAKPGSGGPQVQSDWAENDPQSPAYVKNRPGGYEKITGETVLYPEQATEFLYAQHMNMATISFSSRLKEFDKVRVKFDGNEYVCEAVSSPKAAGALFMGNLGPLRLGPNTGEPFLIQHVPEQDLTIAISLAEGLTHNLAIEKLLIEIDKIPEKFLAERSNFVSVSGRDPDSGWPDALWKEYEKALYNGKFLFGSSRELYLYINSTLKLAVYLMTSGFGKVELVRYSKGTETRFTIFDEVV